LKAGASLGALVLALSSPVGAAGEERVALLLPACELPGVNGSELREAVALDLQADGLLLAPMGELSRGRDVELLIEASCPVPELLTLHAERGSARQARTLRLSELAAEQRPRALSLALTELVSLLFIPAPTPAEEPESAPASASTPPAPPALAPSTPVAPVVRPDADAKPEPSPVEAESKPARASWWLGLAPHFRLFRVTTLGGAQALLSRGRLRYAAGLLMARSETSSGSVWTRLAHVSAAYAFPLWGEPKGSVVESGPRLGFGYGFMSARANDGVSAHDARDWYADGAWMARYQASSFASTRLGIGLELGYGLGPVGYADDSAIARLSGPFVSLTADCSLPL
jgi:hypothetical protein